MPTYDLTCEPCGVVHEDVVCSIDERNSQPCSFCGGLMTTIMLIAPSVVGPMPSKPLRVSGLDREFTSKKEADDYFKANPSTKVVSKNDSSWKDLKVRARERADKMVQKAGFNDSKQYSVAVKEATSKGGSAMKEGQKPRFGK